FFAKGGIEQGEKVFAYFVVKVLPQGVVGIIIAAVLAAAQSTISSGLSAVSNSIIVDFVDKTQWGKGLSAKYKANLSRLLVLLFGSVSLGGGLFLLATKQQQI
ncbi:sodium:solute symporter family transporter, partial [Mycoplasmopsis synoviae]